MINVTEPYMPDKNAFLKRIEKVWETKILTNNGEFVKEFEERIAAFHKIQKVVTVTNCTVGLELCLRLLAKYKVGKVIVTPFTFKATLCAIMSAGYEPLFCDVGPDGNLDPDELEKLVTDNVVAIMPVHVYGVPCASDRISAIAGHFDIPVIYDAAHCFGVLENDKAIFPRGDASVLSLHATKGINSIEGGAIYFKDNQNYERLKEISNFDLNNKNPNNTATNAKLSELHAIFGLSVLDEIEVVLARRKTIDEYYRANLPETSFFIKKNRNIANCNLYAPLILSSSDKVHQFQSFCMDAGVITRRYFYPSLSPKTEVSQGIAERIVCIPNHTNLNEINLRTVCSIVHEFNKIYGI